MPTRRFADADGAQLDRLVKPLLAARVFPDEATLRAVHAARPWALQVNERGDVAVLDRWRDHLDLLAIEALWCSHRHLPATIADLDACATLHGFSGLVSPPVPEVDVPLYRSAGLTLRELLETLERAVEPRTGIAGARSPVRAAGPEDIPAILEADAACFEPFWRYDRRLITRFCDSGDLAIAEQDGRCLGYTLVTIDRDSAVLGRLCVDPSARRMGVGARLLQSAIDRAGAAAARHITLSTQTDNTAALALYRSAGFRITGRRYAFLTTGSEIRGGELDRIGPLMGD